MKNNNKWKRVNNEESSRQPRSTLKSTTSFSHFRTRRSLRNDSFENFLRSKLIHTPVGRRFIVLPALHSEPIKRSSVSCFSLQLFQGRAGEFGGACQQVGVSLSEVCAVLLTVCHDSQFSRRYRHHYLCLFTTCDKLVMWSLFLWKSLFCIPFFCRTKLQSDYRVFYCDVLS